MRRQAGRQLRREFCKYFKDGWGSYGALIKYIGVVYKRGTVQKIKDMYMYLYNKHYEIPAHNSSRTLWTQDRGHKTSSVTRV